MPTRLPTPSTHQQPCGRITSHLSVQRPKPCHRRNPGSMVSPQTMLPVGPGKQRRGGPTPGLPWPRPSQAALGCRRPVWAGAGAATGPAAGTLLLTARLSLNKQGCVATTAPCVGERGSQETFPHGLVSSRAGPSQVASLSCGLPERENAWQPKQGPVRQAWVGMPLAYNSWFCCSWPLGPILV